MDTSQQSQTPHQEEINRFRVVTKVRPFLEDELTGGKKGKHQCTKFYSDNQTVSLIRPNYDQRDFFFDCVLDQDADQETAYEKIAYPVVSDVLNGFNGVVMAYGQTGSGKTHTIFGSRPSLEHLYNNKGGELHYECGIVPRCVSHIFDYIQENPNKAQFRITVSFLEIYMEQITDLLLQTPPIPTSTQHARQSSSYSPIRPPSANSSNNLSGGGGGSSLKLREDPKTGIFVDGLTQINVKGKEQLYQMIKIGAKRRSVNQTAMNKNSSRSHAVLQIFVEQRWVENGNQGRPEREGTPEKKQEFKKRHYKKALLTVVDLAGSERLSKTGSEGLRLQEAKTINKSIAALSNCISALAQDKPLMHVPFRDSKLTRLLTESLGGNSKTTICACISPSLIHYEESYSTLLFATRAMSVRTFVTMNEKVEYKAVDEQGRSTTRLQQTPNEKMLLKQNSKLQEETDELRNEINTLRLRIKQQQSLVSSFTTMPNNNTPNGTPGPHMQNQNVTAYNSNNTHNTSMDGTQTVRHQRQYTSRNGPLIQQNGNQLVRSQSPPPVYSQINPQLSGKHAMMPPALTVTSSNYNQNSPQKMYMAGQNQSYIMPIITSQDSDKFHPLTPDQSQPWKFQQQLFTQQQKDSALIQKLCAMVEGLQEQLVDKTIHVQTLKEENQRLKQLSGLGNASDGTMAVAIDGLLANPLFKQVLFERLSKQQFS